MISPATLITAITTKLAAIPELVKELRKKNPIYAYEDEFPSSNSLLKAIFEMGDKSIMVAWTGTGPGNFGKGEVWKHRFTLYVRGGKYTTLWHIICNGVPANGDGLNFRRTVIHASCYPIHADISAERRTLITGPEMSLDYIEVPLVLTERGDN